jgi:hypothetical protein
MRRTCKCKNNTNKDKFFPKGQIVHIDMNHGIYAI